MQLNIIHNTDALNGLKLLPNEIGGLHRYVASLLADAGLRHRRNRVAGRLVRTVGFGTYTR